MVPAPLSPSAAEGAWSVRSGGDERTMEVLDPWVLTPDEVYFESEGVPSPGTQGVPAASAY